MNELIDMLKKPLTEEELKQMTAEENQGQEKEPDPYTTVLNYFTQRNTESLVRCTKLSLDAIKRRVQTTKLYAQEEVEEPKKAALFKAEIVLEIPVVMPRPTMEDSQAILNKSVQEILKMSQNIPQWNHMINQQKQMQKVR